jgi:hypothetical protein
MPANVHHQTITRSEPRRAWWAKFLEDTGAGFWRETYCMRGGREAIYDNLPHPIGFARNVDARGSRVTPPGNAPEAAPAPNILQLFQNLISTATNPCLIP